MTEGRFQPVAVVTGGLAAGAAWMNGPSVHSPLASAGESEPEAPLRSYLLAKQTVAQLLRDIDRLFQQCAPWATERIHDLMTRLAEDRFQLVVLGQFKRGKSSLMNAIVGRPLLPTGTIPVTSAITSLRYGSRLRAFVRRAGRAFNEEISISALPAFITERGNPGNQKRVLSVAIEVPAPFLRRGLLFIDTPGIGSAHEHNTAATLAFLPEADAAIFVTGADAPLSEGELAFLDAVRTHVRKLFFVLNKIDQLGEGERDELIAYTTELLANRLGSAVRVFSVSAARALAAGQTDPDALASSGLPAFEGALATFLNDERRIVFLVALLDRTIAALEETRFMLGLRQRAHDQTSTFEGGILAELDRQFEGLEQDRRAAIARVVERIAAWAATVLDPALERFAAETTRAVSADLSSSVWPFMREPRRSYADGCAWLRNELQQACATWLQHTARQVDECSHMIVREIQPDIATIVEKPTHIAAAVLGMNEPMPRSDDDGPEARWKWMAPAFEPREADRGPDLAEITAQPSRLRIPYSLAARLAARKLSRRLPSDVDRAVSALRAIVVGYLNACVLGVDISSDGRLAEERRRLESAIKPADGADGVGQRVDAESAARLERLLERATAVRSALLRREALPETVPATGATAITDSRIEPRDGHADDQQPEGDVGRTAGTCTICGPASDAVFNCLCHHQYAIAHDPTARREFLASRGLCPTHTWHLERLSSPRGLSASYPALLDLTAERVRAMIGLPRTGIISRLDELTAGAIACPACRAREQAAHSTAERVVRRLATADGRRAFEQSQWLCLTHLRMILPAVDDDVAARLLRAHTRRIVDLSESMREYVIKLDARRGSLLTDEELRAYREALVLLAGEKYLFRTEAEE